MAMAGRASGRPTVRKLPQAVRPRVRLISSTHTDCSRNAARDNK